MEIKIAMNQKEAEVLQAENYFGVEVCFGDYNAVDSGIDHHGNLSHLPAVAEQAWEMRSNWDGIMGNKFVTTGAADADATFAMLLLAKDSFEGVRIPPSDDLLFRMAKFISKVDTDPIGVNMLEAGEEGELWMTWNLLTAGNPQNSALSFYNGVAAWRNLLSTPNLFVEARKAAKEREGKRVELAEKDYGSKAKFFSTEKDASVVIIPGSEVFGFDVWYGRDTTQEQGEINAWAHHIVLALTARGKNVTIGCPNAVIAEKILGKGGLKNVFPILGEGWGGRESVGGSPRGIQFTEEDLYRFGKKIAEYINTL